MGRIVYGYFGTFNPENHINLNFGRVIGYYDGSSRHLLRGSGIIAYTGAGISNNMDGWYKFDGYGHASGTKLDGAMIGDPNAFGSLYFGFGTYMPVTGANHDVPDVLAMASDEYPTKIEFEYIDGYRTEGMSAPNEGEETVPNIILYPFKTDFSGYEKRQVYYDNDTNKKYRNLIVGYNPAAEGVALYTKPKPGEVIAYPGDAKCIYPKENFKKDLSADNPREKFQGQALGLFRQGGGGGSSWKGFHRVKITTAYVAYTATIGESDAGKGYITNAGKETSIKKERNSEIYLLAEPGKDQNGKLLYVSTGWTVTADGVSVSDITPPWRTSENNYTFMMPSPARDITITPTFEKTTYTVTVTTDQPNEVGTAISDVTSSAWDEFPKLYYNVTDDLYKFNGWTVVDGAENNVDVSLSKDGTHHVFKMPTSNVTATAHFLKHEILWTRSDLSVEQDNYTLTFTKDDDVYDTFGKTVSFELHRNGVKIADFNGNTAVVTLTSNEIGTSYTYKIVARSKHSETEYITADNIATKDYAVYSVTLNISPLEGGYAVAKSGAKTVLVAAQGKDITLESSPNELYVFSNWSSNDVTIGNDGFEMPGKNVTITANFAKHVITWENPTLDVSQNEYDLTFTKGGTVTDSNNILFAFKLLRNGVDLGVSFSGDTATYRMTDAEVEKSYEYTVVAYSVQDEVSTTGATVTFKSQGVHKTIGYFNGEEFVPCIPYYYNGEDWVEVYPHYYDGTEWVLCSMT